MTSLKNATVLVTGAAGGFGQALARQCLAAGSRLILSDVDAAGLTTTAAALGRSAAGGEVRQCVAADLATYAGCEQLFAALEAVPDIVIHNAGLAHFGRFDEAPAEAREKLLAVNLLAPMRLTALCLPAMIARRSGHLVYLSSMAGWIGSAGLVSYSTSKYGLRGFGEALAEEVRGFNIRVTSVFPFFSRTPILNSPRFGTLPERVLPERLLSDPEDAMRAVLRGVERNQREVFPDPVARGLHWLKRLAPGLLPWLNR